MTQHEILFVAVSYLLGSVPFGFILYYITERKDVRGEGSGNIGATNLLRLKGRASGMVILVMDMLKGIIPIIYGLRHFDSSEIIMLGGAAVILGHLFPVYIKFKGGKGIASMLGVFLIFHFPTALVFGITFLAFLYFTKYVSAASVAGVAAVFFSITITHIPGVSVTVLLISILIILKHNANIKRIANGNENTFSWKNNG